MRRTAKRPRVRPDAEGWTERTLLAALRARYPSPEFAVLENVRSHTGLATDANPTRVADALVMGLWPSRGLFLHGFELKTTRADWLRERDNPAKAEAIGRFCDFWWLVAADKELVAEGELPPTWGLLVPRGGRLFALREAPPRDVEPIPRAFLAALFRRLAEGAVSTDDLESKVRVRVAAARDEWERNGRFEVEGLKGRVAELTQTLDAFQARAGVSLDRWNAGDLGALAALLGRGLGRGVLGPARNVIDQLRVLTDEIDRAVAALDARCPGPDEVVACLAPPGDPRRLLVRRADDALPRVPDTPAAPARDLLRAYFVATLAPDPLGTLLDVQGGHEVRLQVVRGTCADPGPAHTWVELDTLRARPGTPAVVLQALALYAPFVMELS